MASPFAEVDRTALILYALSSLSHLERHWRRHFSGAIPMIRTIFTAQATAELTPNGDPRTVSGWLTARDDRFLGVSANRRAVQVKPEPFTLGPKYLARIYCRSVAHARWAEQFSEDVIIVAAP
jgi:hypothetical protein